MSLEPLSSPPDNVQSADSGSGPLLERDYWAIIEDSHCKPSGVMEIVQAKFCAFPPTDVVTFERTGDPTRLDVGDELDIAILLAGECRVRVVHRDACSLTLATLQGHPEAGRITFGAYRNNSGDVIFQIRSRARSSSLVTYIGYLFGGDPMQTSTWTTFIDNVAKTCGQGVRGDVHASTQPIPGDEWLDGDRTMDCPTFIATGD